MNKYNIYSKKNESTILYHALAKNKEHVKKLADEAGFDIRDLEIDEVCHVLDNWFHPQTPFIKDALIH